MNSYSSSLQHIPGLDGVRGLAALLVMLLHMTVMIPDTPAQESIFTIMSAGWIGVDLFFVLSGTLITGILLDSKGKEDGYFLPFYTRRVLRIFPLYYALLVFSFYLLPLFHHPKLDHFSRVTGDEMWYWLFVSNFKMAMAGGPRHGIMDVTWSLAIEEQFYIVWPLLVYVLTRGALVKTCVAMIAGSFALRVAMHFAGYEPFSIYVITPARLDGLCAGALVAIGLRSVNTTQLDQMATGALAGGGIATGAVAFVSRGLPWDGALVQTAGYASVAAMFAGLVLKTALQNKAGGLINRVMRLRFLITLGFYSYAIYLFHLPLRAVLRDTVLKPETFPLFPGGVLAAQLVFYIAGIPLVAAAAWLSYHLWEKHFLRLKSRLVFKGARKVNAPPGCQLADASANARADAVNQPK